MHFSTSALLSGIVLAATGAAYDTVSFTTWNCTECTPVPGTFCSVNTRSQLPPDLCITMWNGSTTIKTYDATLPSCQVNLYPELNCGGMPEVHKDNGGVCESKIPSNSFKITC
ncbi:hypothetical protein BKA58DRAFT_179655 [Alternaria rosae]|uniref:uncharacterized protein n=1 Tax=Alternaria rosae TaxID=1187941 RepID=UPI001E8E978A|nr:uncharacterized protein BKA58DRAFT_179655 [Alternaria rosae]KAH6870586.1 hypothetical protein BKA58DRAFT_179655 [Alternaria rosae]